MVPLQESRDLVDDLGLVAAALEGLDLDWAHAEIPPLAASRDRLVRSIRSYLIPRVDGEELPLTVVFAGPTGSGKSTLVNSLSGRDISATGPLRPTTTCPVVLSSERHASGFGQISDIRCEVIVGGAPILTDVALIDTPDIDSTSLRNRAMAETLIDNADIVVFVTSALRYSDEVPWEVLRRSVSRGAPLIPVLNRITASSAAAVTGFRRRLEGQGLDSKIIRVPEHHMGSGAHQLPSIAVRGLQRRILSLVDDIDATRRGVVERVMRSTAAEVMAIADGLETIVEVERGSGELTRAKFGRGVAHLDTRSLVEGFLVGDVPGDSMRRVGWLWRNRVGNARWQSIVERASRRLVSLVEADLRSLAAAEKRRLPVMQATKVRATSESIAEIWLETVMEAASAGRRFGRRLAALALADAATRGERTSAFDLLFDDPKLLFGMRAELEGLLEPVYESTAGLLTGDPGTMPIDGSDAERLRAVASSITLRSQFAHA